MLKPSQHVRSARRERSLPVLRVRISRRLWPWTKLLSSVIGVHEAVTCDDTGCPISVSGRHPIVLIVIEVVGRAHLVEWALVLLC